VDNAHRRVQGIYGPGRHGEAEPEGKVLAQGSLPASSEAKMHLAICQANPAIGAVVHAHPPVSTAYAIAGKGLDAAFYPEALVTLGVIPCVPYARPGSADLPKAVAPYSLTHNAVLIANHGAVTWGRTLEEAWFRMEALEQYALITLYTGMVGGARSLSGQELNEVLAIRESLGVTTGGIPGGQGPAA
jgi:L-fuculose-phosphate aldolase